ncbi:heat-inducible transcriptional repressor HrcA [Bhargavaea cecembensis]|uniref:heat-inducible transcriptional repressor HrcA n=1 Tax=Bhargavaea cecembensis TaxID=394098 RepID=UPI00058CA534|nr:heat-inducible transcriptional repressor HrcA [Bhargavaea cecembensis]
MMTERQLHILQAIVDGFIQSAQPVGSRQLSKLETVPFSAATIRNDMADLEELGFLEKTHTSSGRVPSEKGYRFYVDHLLEKERLEQEDLDRIRSIFNDRLLETELLIRKTADILSELTTYTSVLLGPDVKQHRVKRFQIIPLSADSAVAIIVTDAGHVEHRTFHVPEEVHPADIERMVNLLNDRLVGIPLHELDARLGRELHELLERHVGRYGDMFSSFREAVSSANDERVVFGGMLNMLAQPEFNDPEKARQVMHYMEDSPFAGLLLDIGKEGIHIRIGSENGHLAMEDCSVITASYTAGEGRKGAIAIIGPTRMDYGRVVSVLDYMSRGLSRELGRLP